MMSARDELLEALRAAMAEVSPGTTVDAAFETPRQADHGDYASNLALVLAKQVGRAPREVALPFAAILNNERPEFVSPCRFRCGAKLRQPFRHVWCFNRLGKSVCEALDNCFGHAGGPYNSDP